MRDRLSTKILSNGATRYGVYDETGNLLRYEYIKLEDEPTVEGDLFSKANMLPDSIPALLGLKMANPQVKDALNVLAHVGNLHVWSRTITLTDSTYKPVVGEDNYSVTLNPGDKLYYSDSVDIASLQDINLASPVSTFSFTGNNFPSVVGKYFRKNNEATIYIYPESDQSIAGSTLWLRGCHVISAAVDIPAGTYVDYLTSTDRNAYTDGTVGNTTITYLGQLGGGARIEVGSYVGTGTYGSSNPNSLTFGFEPKIVKLLFRTITNVGRGDLKREDLTGEGFNRSQNFMVADRLTAEYAQGEGFGYSSSSSYGKKSPDGKTFYWYSTDGSNQCNSSGYVYYYIAIC